jgi:hypothetical protein
VNGPTGRCQEAPKRSVRNRHKHDSRVDTGRIINRELAKSFPERTDKKPVAVGDERTRLAGSLRLCNIEHAATQIESCLHAIIIPTHAGRFRHMLLGSTAAKVLNDAPCPVLTSKHAETIAPRPLEHREWLCAVDLSAYAETVLRTGKRMSEQARANMSLIHVVNREGHARVAASVRTPHEA